MSADRNLQIGIWPGGDSIRAGYAKISTFFVSKKVGGTRTHWVIVRCCRCTNQHTLSHFRTQFTIVVDIPAANSQVFAHSHSQI